MLFAKFSAYACNRIVLSSSADSIIGCGRLAVAMVVVLTAPSLWGLVLAYVSVEAAILIWVALMKPLPAAPSTEGAVPTALPNRMLSFGAGTAAINLSCTAATCSTPWSSVRPLALKQSWSSSAASCCPCCSNAWGIFHPIISIRAYSPTTETASMMHLKASSRECSYHSFVCLVLIVVFIAFGNDIRHPVGGRGMLLDLDLPWLSQFIARPWWRGITCLWLPKRSIRS